MVELGSLSDYFAYVDARKLELGLVENTEAMRNRGGNRTPAKRANLAAAAERAKAAGGVPIPAYF